MAVGEACLREAREHKDALARANAELYAEMQRLAAESALGPLMVMDADGHVSRLPIPLHDKASEHGKP